MFKTINFIIFFLASNSGFAMNNEITTYQSKTPESAKDQIFTINLNVTNNQSHTLKNIIEDEKSDILLPNLSAAQLNLLLPVIKNLAELCQEKSNENNEEILTQYLQKTLAGLKSHKQPSSNQQLIQSIANANYEVLAEQILNSNEWQNLESLGDKLKKLWQLHPAKNLALKGLSLKHTRCNDVIESSDGNNLISWSIMDDTIKIWNRNEPVKEPITLNHPGCAGVIEHSNSKLISWSRDDNTIKIWEITNLDQDPTPITLQHYNCDGLIEIYNGKKLISWSAWDDTIKIWDLNNLQKPIIRQHAYCNGVIELSNGNLVSQSWKDNTIKVWAKDNLQNPITLHHAYCNGVIELSNGNLVSRGSTIKIWDIKNLNQDPITLQHYYCNGVIELSNGNLISYGDDLIKVWDINNLQNPITLLYHKCGYAIESADGQNLISSGEDTIKIWKIKNLAQDPITLHHSYCKNIIESTDGKNLISCGADTIKIWFINNLNQDPITLKHYCCDKAIELCNGNLISWSWNDSTIKIWDMALLNPTPQQIYLLLAVYFASEGSQNFDLPAEKLSELKIIFNELSSTTQESLEQKAPNFITKIKEAV